MSKKNEVAKPLAQFEMNLDSLLDKGISALPQDVNADRLKINAMMKISQDDNLMKVAKTQPSVIAQYVYNFVIQGLDMLAGEAYIVPYKGKLTPVIDYKGEKKIAMQYSLRPISIIQSDVVYAEDDHGFDEEGNFYHKFSPFDTNRGDKIGAYCIIKYKDGTRHQEFANKDEIAKVRGISPSSSSSYSPWNMWEDQMWEKTVIKKAMKYVNLDFRSSDVQKAYLESSKDVEFKNERSTKQETVEQSDVFDGAFVEAEFTEADNEVIEVEVALD